jgi:hypothetical protein
MLVNLNAQPLAGSEAVTDARISLEFAQPFPAQVKVGLEKAGVDALRRADEVVLPLQPHAALLAGAMIYGIGGVLPVVSVLDPGASWARCGNFDGWAQRQAARKDRRGATAPRSDRVTVVNYSHPISPDLRTALAAKFEVEVESIDWRDIRVQLDVKADLPAQFVILANAAGVRNWEEDVVVINPPTMGWAAYGILSEIHGRRGRFPMVPSIREPKRGEGFQLMELLNLDEATEEGRRLAAAFDASQAPVSVPRELAVKLAQFLEAYRLGNEKDEFGTQGAQELLEKFQRLLA